MRYKRHLPHSLPEGAVLPVSWHLAGSLPSREPEILFRNSVRLKPSGPMWLTDPRIAQIVVDALHFGAEQRNSYELFPYVVMPNHVHILIEPFIELPVIMRWLKGRTARTANRLLGRTNQSFWQDESYDHWIRSAEEFKSTAHYIEQNPVRARLVEFADQWRWSSASAVDRPQKTMVSPKREANGY
jgi:putative transposase